MSCPVAGKSALACQNHSTAERRVRARAFLQIQQRDQTSSSPRNAASLSSLTAVRTVARGRGRGTNAVASAFAAQSAKRNDRMPIVAARASAHAGASATASALETANVVIFTTPSCPYCRQAKSALAAAGASYSEVDVAVSADLRSAVSAVSGMRTVPQIFVGGNCIGGADDLDGLIKEGKLASMLSAAASSPALPSELAGTVASMIAAGPAAPAAAAPPSTASAGAAASSELEQLADRMSAASGGVRRANKTAFGGLKEPRKQYKRVFTAKDGIDWLVSSGAAKDASAAAALGQRLQDELLLRHVDDTVAFSAAAPGDFFRLRRDVPLAGGPLNGARAWRGPPRPALAIATELRQRIVELYDQFLSPDGRYVDYEAMAKSDLFRSFVDAAGELQAVDLEAHPLPRAERIAFFVNVYNALVVHGIAVLGAPTNLATRLAFFGSIRYNIGGLEYSPDDIENGVLRGNRPSAASIGALSGQWWLSRGPFAVGDARRRFVVLPMDPRVHMALNCGARSCPPIRVFSASALESELEEAAAAFCESEVAVDAAEGTVTLSKIFKWYCIDFGANERERLEWILPRLPAKRQEELRALLAGARGELAAATAAASRLPFAGDKPVTVKYAEYDWTINAKK